MNHTFSQKESLRIAIEMERAGQQFYRSVIRLAKNPEAQAHLKELADQENEHMAAFQRMYEQAQEPPDGKDSRYDQEANAYLSALAAELVFPGGAMASALKRELRDMTDILLAGIASEKDAILFYTDIQSRAEDQSVVKGLDKIIAEERGHLSTLREMLEQIGEVGLS